MKILVVGASGFIGKNFLIKYHDQYDITALYRRNSFPDFIKKKKLNNVSIQFCDLLYDDSIEAAFMSIKKEWDLCLFLASYIDLAASAIDPRPQAQVNILGLINFLLKIRCKRFIYISSGSVYNDLDGLVHPARLPSPSLPYAISKLAAEYYLKYAKESAKTIDEYLIIRLFSAYGPYEDRTKIYTRLVRAFGIEKKNSFKISGNGKNLLNPMYIDDTVNGIERAIYGVVKNKIVDYSGNENISIESLVEIVSMLFMGKVASVEKTGDVPSGITFYPSNEAFKIEIGYSPKVKLENGLKNLYDHLINEPNE